MSEPLTLLDRLRHFEQYHLEARDEYGAEVLHNAIAAVEERDALAAALSGLVRASNEVRAFAVSWEPLTPGDIRSLRDATVTAEKVLATRIEKGEL